jgi:hypothetical protein
MIRTVPVLALGPSLLLLAGFLAAGTAEAADVSGHVYIIMASGDVKRAADTEVFLVAPAFAPALAEARRKIIEAEDKKSLGKAGLVLRFVRDEERAAREECRKAQAKEREHLCLRAEGLQREVRQWEEYNRSDRVQQVASDLIARHAIRSSRTNIEGRYAITGVRQGSYLLVAVYSVFFTRVCWMVPIELGSAPLTVDLSGSNAGVCQF